MNIIIKREAGLKLLQSINNIIEKKQTKPILSNVLLLVEEDKLRLIGTDTDIEFIGIAHLEEIIEKGSVTVSAKKLYDIFRACEENSVLHLMLQGQIFVVQAKDSRFSLNTLPKEGFPNLSQPHFLAQYVLKEQQLRYLFSRVYYAMGLQESRRYLNGACLDIEKEAVKCVAMDGHRLALASITGVVDEGVPPVNAKFILPRKSVLELMRLLDPESSSPLTIEVADNRVRVVTNTFIFTSNLINSTYPQYQRLIPQSTVVALGDREAIKQAIIRVSILSNEKMRGVRCRFKKNSLMITANNLEREQAEEIVPLEYEGNNLIVAFNASYLLDILSVIPTSMVRIHLIKSDSAILIVSDSSEDCAYVVMPMRL